MRTLALLSIAGLSIVIGCEQEPPDDIVQQPPPTEEESIGKKYFDTHVMPILEGRCAGCHSNPGDPTNAPDYLGASKDSFYDMLVGNALMVRCDVAQSILLLKSFDKDHPGGSLSASERGEVDTWLTIEAQDRFGGTCDDPQTTDPPDPPTPGMLTGQEAMKQFGDCMTIEDWKSTGMHLVANQTCTYLNNANNTCYGCHNSGQGSNWMPDPTDDAAVAEAFEKMRYAYGSFNLIRWSVNPDGSFNDIVPSNRWRDKGKVTVVDENTKAAHPTYELTQENSAAIDAWFNLTYEKWKNGPCAP
jgi:hypothetical protein